MSNFEKEKDIMSGSGENGEWATVNGAHIFIKNGQSIKNAFKDKKDVTSKKSAMDELKEISSEISNMEKKLGKKEYSKKYENSHDTKANEYFLNNADLSTRQKYIALTKKKAELSKQVEKEFLDNIRNQVNSNQKKSDN